MTLLRLLVAVIFLVISSLAEVKVSIDLRTVERDFHMLGLYYMNGGNRRATAYIDFGKDASVRVKYEKKDGTKFLKLDNENVSLEYDFGGTMKHLINKFQSADEPNPVTVIPDNPVIFYNVSQRSFMAHDTTSEESLPLNLKHKNSLTFMGTYIEPKKKPYVVIKYWKNFKEAIGEFVANKTIGKYQQSVLLSSDDDKSYFAFHAWELPVSYSNGHFVPSRQSYVVYNHIGPEDVHITGYIEAEYVASPQGNTLFFDKHSPWWKRPDDVKRPDDRAERVSFARNDVLGVRDPSYDRTRWLTYHDLEGNFEDTLLNGHSLYGLDFARIVKTVAHVNINKVEDVENGFPFYVKGHILWLTENNETQNFNPFPEYTDLPRHVRPSYYKYRCEYIVLGVRFMPIKWRYIIEDPRVRSWHYEGDKEIITDSDWRYGQVDRFLACSGVRLYAFKDNVPHYVYTFTILH